jgi:acyl-CoA dehydrogenase
MIPELPGVSYWEASPHFRALCRRRLDDAAYAFAEPRLIAMGEQAATVVAPLAAIADKQSPRLVTHDPQGRRIDRVDYHPSYREMERIAYGSGMIALNYSDHDHQQDARFIGFALGYLFAMAEMGLYCPLCMTDGVAHVVTRHGSPEQIARVVPHLTSTDPSTLWTGGMFVTERAGGSDVGANETVARRGADGVWRLTGQKWFCSNVDAQAVLLTARPEGASEGTRGLRTFLLLPRGNRGFAIDRLKEKLGVRSMPTGEVTLTDAPVEELGGFEAMADMLNLSRLYNAVASVAVMGRAIHEARWYVERRRAFGRAVAEMPLVQQTLAELESQHLRALLLTFEAVDAMRRGDTELLRILTPIAKQRTGKLAVSVCSEAMELVGGNGYIEDWPMARLLRDAQVLPIWEGTTNILVLDTLRAARRERAHERLLARLDAHTAAKLAASLSTLEERDARRWVDVLTHAFETALLKENGYGEGNSRSPAGNDR